MPHIHTESGHYDHTVTAYIVRDDFEAPRLLLHMHKKLNVLLAIGGHIELNETPWAAMAHEIEEEAGYAIKDLNVLQPKVRIGQYDDVVVHPQPIIMNTHDITADHYHSDTSYAFVAHSAPTLTLADGESADLRWLTQQEIISLPDTDVRNNTRQTALAVLAIFLSEWEAVPATDFRIDTISRY
jgi:8-oxo-dGTP diphosphatase